MKTAFIFPGQGAQKVGMGRSLSGAARGARQAFQDADRALGFSLSTLCFEGPEEELKLTANTQPAILAASVAALRALGEHGIEPDFVAGHSLGEYSALVAAGALRFEDALRVVRRRGLFMQEAVAVGEGAMAALIGCDIEVVREVCREASDLGICSPANINSPRQTVIAGHRSAVERAVALARERGARKAVMLPVSAPFHCELMRPASQKLAVVLGDTEFNDLTVPLVTNVDAAVIATGAQARDALCRQVVAPVRWSESVGRLLEEGVTRFVELGPGKVLSGLVRQMDRECEILNIEDEESLSAAVAALSPGGE
ncbi:MAG TPA: ACP S-malonyltransferase [Blastocatellia bacterium]|jgi:[acyl-carrier-protein] S-malonyltransferase|nr:ACP S-malonyltransferase [Blastocatellia bacterium]